jgi:hypothetical protein
MNRDSTRKLKNDRRLIHRRGWISKTEYQKHLDTLPDVSDKIAPPEDSEGEEEARSDTEAPPRAE